MSDKKMKPSITHSDLPFIGKATERKPSTCPYCGADSFSSLSYECMSQKVPQSPNGWTQSYKCQKRELMQLKAALREVVESWAVPQGKVIGYLDYRNRRDAAIAAAAKLLDAGRKSNG